MSYNGLALFGIVALVVIVALCVTLLLAEIFYGDRVDRAIVETLDQHVATALANVRDLAELTDDELEDIYRDPDTPSEVRDEIDRLIDGRRERADYEQTARYSR